MGEYGYGGEIHQVSEVRGQPKAILGDCELALFDDIASIEKQ